MKLFMKNKIFDIDLMIKIYDLFYEYLRLNRFLSLIIPPCPNYEDSDKDCFSITFTRYAENYNENEEIINDFIKNKDLEKYIKVISMNHIKIQKCFQTEFKIKLTKLGKKYKESLIGLFLLQKS